MAPCQLVYYYRRFGRMSCLIFSVQEVQEDLNIQGYCWLNQRGSRMPVGTTTAYLLPYHWLHSDSNLNFVLNISTILFEEETSEMLPVEHGSVWC